MVIELSGGQFGLKSYAWFFFFTSMISNQNCTTWGSITTLLHPFWNCPNTGLGQFKYFIDAVLSRSEIKVTHFLREKNKSFGNKSCHNLPLFVFHFSVSCVAFWALKSDWLFCFWRYFLLGWEKKFDLEQKMVRFVNKSHQLEPIRLQGPSVISKWVL